MLFQNIAHVGSFKHFVFVYLCILHLIHGMSYLISLNLVLFKNKAHVWSFKYIVFVYFQDVQDVRKMCARCVQGVHKMYARCAKDVCKVCA